ncbi:MAG: hypothetical protein AAGC74_09650 [Verrucomicrobiota bacterium]
MNWWATEPMSLFPERGRERWSRVTGEKLPLSRAGELGPGA